MRCTYVALKSRDYMLSPDEPFSRSECNDCNHNVCGCVMQKDLLESCCTVHHSTLYSSLGAVMQQSKEDIMGSALLRVLEQDSQLAPRASDIMLYFWLSREAFKKLKGIH